MDKNKHLHAGFSFLELLIVISIMILFSTLSVGGYTAFNESKKIDSGTNELISTIELAKKKSRAGDKSGIVLAGVDQSACDLDGYKVTLLSASSYALQASMCTNVSPSCTLGPGCTDITIASFLTAPSMSLTPTTGSVEFRASGVAVSGISSIIVTNTKNNKFKTITINGAGIVEAN
ncbi:MAG: hypothetical protein WBO77_03455 [Microgenomates group bacterium]